MNDTKDKFEIIVRAIIKNRDGGILLVKRVKEPARNLWSLPGGKVEFGETVVDAIKRELLEELGIRFKPIDSFYKEDVASVEGYHCLVIHFIGSYQGKIKLKTDENGEYRFFSKQEIKKSKSIGFDHHEVLLKFLEKDKVKKHVQVGVGCIIIKDGKILLGKRRGSHGEGEYSGCGGHLEYGETVEQCIIREVKEETGMDVKMVRHLGFDHIIQDGKHYFDATVLVKHVKGKPKVLEPHRVENWRWYPLDKLPKPLFGVNEQAIQTYKNNTVYLPK